MKVQLQEAVLHAVLAIYMCMHALDLFTSSLCAWEYHYVHVHCVTGTRAIAVNPVL